MVEKDGIQRHTIEDDKYVESIITENEPGLTDLTITELGQLFYSLRIQHIKERERRRKISNQIRLSGEEWVNRGESNTDFLMRIIGHAQSDIKIVTADLQELFVQPEIASLIERQLKASVQFEIIAPEVKKVISLSSVFSVQDWSGNGIEFYSLGLCTPRLQFVIVDGRYTLHKEADYTGLQPATMLKGNDAIWSRGWDQKFDSLKAQLVGVKLVSMGVVNPEHDL